MKIEQKKCPTKINKELERDGRGSYDFQFDEQKEISLVKWNDIKCVTVATNFDTVEPLANVLRWNKGKRIVYMYLSPDLFTTITYRFMGGVDQHDWLLNKHGIAVTGKNGSGVWSHA